MDRRVKERLLGASILVVLIVLIVPELLSGPAPPAPPARPPNGSRAPASAPEPIRNVTVDLATSKAPAPEPPDAADSSNGEQLATQSAAASAAGAAVAAGADARRDTGDSPPAPPPATLPAGERASPRVETPRTASTNVSARPAGGRSWALQLGSFASRANADKLVHQLKAQGFAVYVVSGGARSSLRYRVRVGPMADRGAAAQALAKLKALGHTASFVPPAR